MYRCDFYTEHLTPIVSSIASKTGGGRETLTVCILHYSCKYKQQVSRDDSLGKIKIKYNKI